jgi:hypothetical protein
MPTHCTPLLLRKPLLPLPLQLHPLPLSPQQYQRPQHPHRRLPLVQRRVA